MPLVTDDPRCRVPIPHLPEPPNWARLPIEECGDFLTVVNESPRLRVYAAYAEMSVPGAGTTLRLRQGAYTRLCRAAASLPDQIALCLFDGFRPLSVQRHLYTGYWEEVARAHPEWEEKAVAAQVQQFVALPNPSPDAPPPHRTGGAADVYLLDARTGEPLPMGTEPDEISPRSITGWYENHPESPFTENRRLLYHALTDQGFTNYHGEWWHFDFGNQRWANLVGAKAAFYGLPAQERSPELWPLVPHHKADFERVQKVVQVGYPAIEPIVPELLAWLQDTNWPIAWSVGDFLSNIGEPLAPFVRRILIGDDAIWKRGVLRHVVAPSSPLIASLRADLENLVAQPTVSEDDTDLVEAARDALAEQFVDRTAPSYARNECS